MSLGFLWHPIVGSSKSDSQIYFPRYELVTWEVEHGGTAYNPSTWE
jgi:hypothetical protein